MLADFLGKGWSFPVALTHAGEIEISPGEKSIQEAIWIIIATAPGERLMRPEFGCGIHRLVFSLDDAATVGTVTEEVRLALIRWEPRIDVLGVDTEVRERGEMLLINIHYRVRSTNNFFNLVYPFYLTAGIQQ
jgi:phage baseplate assembly protein W